MSAITAGFISSDDYDTTAIQELRRKTPKKRTNEDPFPEDASTQISSFKFRDNSTRENVEIKIHQVIIARCLCKRVRQKNICTAQKT